MKNLLFPYIAQSKCYVNTEPLALVLCTKLSKFAVFCDIDKNFFMLPKKGKIVKKVQACGSGLLLLL